MTKKAIKPILIFSSSMSLLILLQACYIVLAQPMGRIAFVSDSQIHVVREIGGESAQLTTLSQNTSPSWSPDGAKMAFLSTRNGSVGFDGEIYVMKADGSDQTRITYGMGSNPVWSPDGMKIAFESESSSSDKEICVINVDGTNLHAVTDNAQIDQNPVWSPDGTKIAFESFYVDTGFDIVMVNTDGSGFINLTANHEETHVFADDINLSWSPDGKKMVFESYRYGVAQVCIMDVAGNTPLNNLSNDISGDINDNNPEFSPDGRRIAFQRSANGNNEIYIMHLDGSSVTNLTNNSATNNFDPQWSPDGETIIFRRSTTSTVCSVSVTSRKVTELCSYLMTIPLGPQIRISNR